VQVAQSALIERLRAQLAAQEYVSKQALVKLEETEEKLWRGWNMLPDVGHEGLAARVRMLVSGKR